MNVIIQTIPSTLISELLASSKLDGVILDTEHGCFNNETLYRTRYSDFKRKNKT
jgi:2-keto-3-deoxy-L-rhamnonate aldolase RhmA